MSGGYEIGSGTPGQPGLSPRALLIAMIAVGCGLLAALYTSMVVHNNQAPEEKTPAGFVVARKDINAGTHIGDPAELFKLVQYRAGDEPKDALRSLEGLLGRVVVRPLAEDQPVKERDLGK